MAPAIGQPIKIMAVGDGAGELALTDPKGAERVLDDGPSRWAALEHDGGLHPDRRGQPPADLEAGREGDRLSEGPGGGEAAGARDVGNVGGTERLGDAHTWDHRYENFYSAWIATLFDAPVDQSLDFRPLHQALRDPARNFLYGYLGLREDDPKNKAAIKATPDCADLPYFLRAYFAWKLGLPFGFRDCDRGNESRPPRCTTFYSNDDAPNGKDTLAAVKSFFRQLANRVQSGSARTGLDDDATDYYPVPLERTALRPGVIYADPYGHVMVVVKWVEQTADKGGLLLAVDGQPDTSIGRKRFWEGTFLFNSDVKSAGPGFKAFRPLARGADGKLEPLANAAIGRKGDAAHAPFSDDQKKMSSESLLRAHGQADQPGRARRGEGVPRDAGRAGRADDRAGRLGRQRREVLEGEGAGAADPDAGRPEDLRDRRPVGGLRDAVARHAPADRDERAAGAARPDRQAPGALQPRRQEARGGARRDREAAREPDRRRAASPTRAATARRRS